MKNLDRDFVNKSEKYLVISIGFFLFIASIFIFFMPNTTLLPMVPGFIAGCGILIFFASMQTAFLLYSQSKLDFDSGVSFLASGYLSISFLAFTHTLFLPGIFFSANLFPENSQISAWLWIVWHLIFPIFIILYSLVNLGKLSCSYKLSQWIFRFTPIGIFLLIILLINIEPLLPMLIVDGKYGSYQSVDSVLIFLLTAFSFILLIKSRGLNNRQDLWLTLAIIVHGLDVFYGIVGEARYSLGWYLGMISSVISSSIILSVFIYQIFNIAQSKNQENLHLKDISELDPLTGIANRRKFNLLYRELWNLSFQQQKPICLILLDIDHFKSYNDSFGHPSGDLCLIKIAKILSDILKRKADFATRMGGEEFALLLYGAPEKINREIAEESRKAVESLRIPYSANSTAYVTVSVGYGTIIADQTITPEAFYNMVDQALFKAKAEGRNRVECIPPPSIKG